MMHSISSVVWIGLLLAGCSLAQYQDGNYEGNLNPYPRSQYDSNDEYAPRPSGYRGNSASSYPKSNRVSNVPKAKTEEEVAAEEEEKKPSALELLLANSKFTCSNKKDGYYADNSVNCQVFHYCVGGAKHSWMCPEDTVFHQVHLNCVPAAQDICSQSEKYHIVNEYLHKPIEQNYGPNQTIRYHQRYYPEEFLGDPLASPQPGVQQYGSPPPASSGRQSGSNYARPSSSSSSSSYGYEDENSAAYRAAPSYPSPSAPISRPSTKPSYSSFPTYNSQPKLNAPVEPAYKPLPKKVVTSYGYPNSAPLSPAPAVRQRPPAYDPYDDGSYKPSSTAGYNGPSSTAYQPHRSQPSYKPSAPAYQPYSTAAAAASPSYKPTLTSANYRSTNQGNKPAYSAYQGYQGAGAYNTGANQPQNNQRSSSGSYESSSSKPYDYSGVTYEEDY